MRKNGGRNREFNSTILIQIGTKIQQNHTLKSVHVDFSKLIDSGLSPVEFPLFKYFSKEN